MSFSVELSMKKGFMISIPGGKMTSSIFSEAFVFYRFYVCYMLIDKVARGDS